MTFVSPIKWSPFIVFRLAKVRETAYQLINILIRTTSFHMIRTNLHYTITRIILLTSNLA